VTGILCFALADGRHLRTLRLPAGRTGFLNDLVIDPSTGTIYATNTSTGAAEPPQQPMVSRGVKQFSSWLPQSLMV
jgi:hypothetical protein